MRRSKQYLLVDGKLWRKNAKEESCGNHVDSRTLVSRALRAGFYWPSAVANAEKLVRHCEGCQFFTKRIHVPAHEIQTIPASGPSHAGD